jgi:hypothetical protein
VVSGGSQYFLLQLVSYDVNFGLVLYDTKSQNKTS